MTISTLVVNLYQYRLLLGCMIQSHTKMTVVMRLPSWNPEMTVPRSTLPESSVTSPFDHGSMTVVPFLKYFL